jgi:hypothetical protein
MVRRPITPALTDEQRKRIPSTPPTTTEEAEERARGFLEAIGHADHPDAEKNPIYALYQVAVDYRCTAHGYRSLYFHREGAPDA